MNVIEIKEGWLEKGWTEAQNHPFTTCDHCFSADEGGPPKKCNFIEVNQTEWGRSGMIRLLLQTTWRPFMSKQTDQGGQKKELKSMRDKPFAWVILGLEFFSRLPGVHFQHHHPLIRSFFPEKFCWKVQTILHPYKTFCSILPNLSIQFGWLNSQNSVSLNLMRCPSKFYSIHSKQHFTSGFFLFKDASHFPDPQNLWCTLRCQVEERVIIQTIRGAFKKYLADFVR